VAVTTALSCWMVWLMVAPGTTGVGIGVVGADTTLLTGGGGSLIADAAASTDAGVGVGFAAGFGPSSTRALGRAGGWVHAVSCFAAGAAGDGEGGGEGLSPLTAASSTTWNTREAKAKTTTCPHMHDGRVCCEKVGQ
jgi:hypothetical protein